MASKANSEGVQEILEAHGSQVKKQALNSSLRSSVIGCTTTNLSEAIECISIMVNHGANINSEEPYHGKTALMMACEKGYFELVQTLLD